MIRPTIRLRLTLVFAALFVVLSAVLITSAYLFLANEPGRGRLTEEADARMREALIEAGIPPRSGELGEQGERLPRRELPQEIREVIDEISADARQQVLNDLLIQSFIAFAITASISVVLAWWVAGRALAPVDSITEAAGRLSEDNLDHRLTDEGPDDELHRLRGAFNGMLDRLQEGFESRRRFAADASHELRTPLAVLRARADNVLADPNGQNAEQLARDVRTEVDRADRLVEALLALARAEQPTDSQPIDLADLVGDVVGYLAPEADRSGVEIELELTDAPTSGDPALIRQLVVNLIRNAIVHNRAGGSVSVAVSARPSAARLVVANTGAVVAEEEVDALFRRFHRGRAATDRHGHGLGLAIVEAVARAHDADLAPKARPGGGLEVAVTFDGGGAGIE